MIRRDLASMATISIFLFLEQMNIRYSKCTLVVSFKRNPLNESAQTLSYMQTQGLRGEPSKKMWKQHRVEQIDVHQKLKNIHAIHSQQSNASSRSLEADKKSEDDIHSSDRHRNIFNHYNKYDTHQIKNEKDIETNRTKFEVMPSVPTLNLQEPAIISEDLEEGEIEYPSQRDIKMIVHPSPHPRPIPDAFHQTLNYTKSPTSAPTRLSTRHQGTATAPTRTRLPEVRNKSDDITHHFIDALDPCGKKNGQSRHHNEYENNSKNYILSIPSDNKETGDKNGIGIGSEGKATENIEEETQTEDDKIIDNPTYGNQNKSNGMNTFGRAVDNSKETWKYVLIGLVPCIAITGFFLFWCRKSETFISTDSNENEVTSEKMDTTGPLDQTGQISGYSHMMNSPSSRLNNSETEILKDIQSTIFDRSLDPELRNSSKQSSLRASALRKRTDNRTPNEIVLDESFHSKSVYDSDSGGNIDNYNDDDGGYLYSESAIDSRDKESTDLSFGDS